MTLALPSSLDLAVVGNCAWSTLIDGAGTVVWGCLPGVDGDPWFHALLSGEAPDQGFWAVDLEGFVGSEQHYRRNSAVLETILRSADGSAVEIVDCAPRFTQFGRLFRPTMLVRQIRPLAGTPRIRIRLRPGHSWGAERPQVTRGSNHARYVAPDLTKRLYTNASLGYVMNERWFLLERDACFLLGPDESLREAVQPTVERMIVETDHYWRAWARGLSIPFEWQDAVIRAAITLKLCNVEETGAIVAALTPSVPEAPDSGRNWDYRYCWLRDSYFTVNALNRLGTTQTMEGYLHWILNVVAGAPDGYLQPMFGVELQTEIEERTVDHLPGYRGMGPVRLGNAAYKQVQNDGYGSVILAATHVFFDRRLINQGDGHLFHRLEALGEQARRRFDQPDAGPWEYRNTQLPHTYSALLCWAACDRLGRIAAHLGHAGRAAYWQEEAARIHGIILERAWSEERQSFVSPFDGDRLDASLLLIPQLGFLPARDPKFLATLHAIESELKSGDYLYRYVAEDDFGRPETAFAICSFWYVDALAAVGRKDEARALFEKILGHRNHLGLLSEDIDPVTGQLWGNFPQTYSMVGIIHSAMCLSRGWEDAT